VYRVFLLVEGRDQSGFVRQWVVHLWVYERYGSEIDHIEYQRHRTVLGIVEHGTVVSSHTIVAAARWQVAKPLVAV